MHLQFQGRSLILLNLSLSSCCKVSEISGGITNVLWKLHPAEKALDAVVVRIFGKQTDKIIDRDQEKRVLGPLNKAGFGAQVPALS